MTCEAINTDLKKCLIRQQRNKFRHRSRDFLQFAYHLFEVDNLRSHVSGATKNIKWIIFRWTSSPSLILLAYNLSDVRNSPRKRAVHTRELPISLLSHFWWPYAASKPCAFVETHLSLVFLPAALIYRAYQIPSLSYLVVIPGCFC